MAAATTGRFDKKDKAHPGWRWQVYADPASPTGWVKKIWDPLNPSEEFFQNYDYQADEEDAAAAAAKSTAEQTAKGTDRAALVARQDAADKQRDTELDLLYGDKGDERKSRETIASKDRKARMAELELRLKNDKRQFDMQFGLDQAKLGADILKTGASLRGPDDLVQGWAYAQGVTDSGLSPYVQAVRNGTATAYGGGTARAGNPAPVTVGSLAKSMGAGGGGAAAGGGGASYGVDTYGRPRLAPDKQAFVDDVGRSVSSGLANKPLGYFENMTDPERKGFFSAASYDGADSDAEYEYYKRSRPGQRSALLG